MEKTNSAAELMEFPSDADLAESDEDLTGSDADLAGNDADLTESDEDLTEYETDLAESDELPIIICSTDAINDTLLATPVANDAEEIDLEAIDLTPPVAEKNSPTANKDRVDAIQFYYSEMVKIPVQSREEETELGSRIIGERERLAMLRRQRKSLKAEMNEDLPHGKKTSLLKQIEILDEECIVGKKKANALESELVLHNLRLVVLYARKIRNKGIDLMDLIQEGNKGMIWASKKFDPSRGYRFSTYAKWWIHAFFSRYTREKCHTIKWPNYIWQKRVECHRAEDILNKEHNNDPDYRPTWEEIAKIVGTTAEKVRKMEELPLVTQSLATPVIEGEDIYLLDVIPDDNAPPTDDAVSQKSEKTYLTDLLKTLSPRELLIIKKRFGLDAESQSDEEGMTLEAIGKEQNVTRECIRQIQNRALEKLRRAGQKKE